MRSMTMDNDSRKFQREAALLRNDCIKGDYFRATFQVEDIPGECRPGQFIHLRIPGLEHRILRRPFSVFNVEEDCISIIYKVVGEGTARLSTLAPGCAMNILGPLGRPFAIPSGEFIIVAGGYGCAATYLLARRSPEKPLVLIGGRSSGDILLKEEYQHLGCKVLVSTDDGAEGFKGRVTGLLETVARPGSRIAACGPLPMLKALQSAMEAGSMEGELSLDHAMCCGVGACFACVTKLKDGGPQGWRYARICKEGPVFNAGDILF